MRTLLLALGLAAGMAAAATERVQPTPADFAQRWRLHSSGNNGVVALTLPLPVYLASRSPGLADLRVFDTEGRPLPFHLDWPVTTTALELRQQEALRFPVQQTTPRSGAAAAAAQVEIAADGSLRWQRNAPLEVEQRNLRELILDVGTATAGERLLDLRFELPGEVRHYQALLAVDRSSDLEWWEDAAQGHLQWLDSADGTARLSNDLLALPAGHGRYLRLRWLQGEPLLFARVHGRWQRRVQTPAPVHELWLEASAGRVSGDHVYRAGPAIAATELGLELPRQNTVLLATLGRYRDGLAQDPGWRFEAQLSATFHRLLQDGRERRSGLLAINALANAEWVLRSEAPTPAPRLLLRWQPQRLVYLSPTPEVWLAIGATPEQLRRWSGGPAPLAQVAPGYSATELARLEQAEFGAPLAEAPLVAQPQPPPAIDPAERRRWLLWGVLGIGVLLLGALSINLARQMKREQSR